MFAHANSERMEDAEWIIVGIPSELGSLSKVKNYQEGPEAVRDGSYRVFQSIFGDIREKRIFDYGDLELEDIKDLKTLYGQIYLELDKIYDPNKKYFFIGGDHSITYPIIKLLKKYHDFYMLFFDAHPDCHPDPYPNYQSFMYYLIKEGIVDPKKIVYVGVNDWSFDEREFIEKMKIKYYTPFDIWDDPNKVSKEISEILKGKTVYVTIDIDVFDMGCGHWLTPFGIRPYHFFKIIKNLEIKLLGFDIVELYPNEICENLAAKIGLEMMSLF